MVTNRRLFNNFSDPLRWALKSEGMRSAHRTRYARTFAPREEFFPKMRFPGKMIGFDSASAEAELCEARKCEQRGPFLPDHLPRPGHFHFPVQQLQEAAVITPPEASWYSLSGQQYGVQGQRPWCFPSAFQKADSRPEGHEPRKGYALLPIKRYMARHRQTTICVNLQRDRNKEDPSYDRNRNQL